MILPTGLYRYEILRSGSVEASEETRFDGSRVVGIRRSLDGVSRNEVEADVAGEGLVRSIRLRYTRGPFSRNAAYDVAEDFLRGSVSTVGGRNAVTAKLGRFREIDADFLFFRSLTLAHIRVRKQTRWTGRVAVIDSATLVATSVKQSARAQDPSGLTWVYEPRMGDSEELEIDSEGRIIHRRDILGVEAVLVA